MACKVSVCQRGLALCAQTHVPLVKSCRVIWVTQCQLGGPPWVNSCICCASMVGWSGPGSLYNRAEMVTAARRSTDGFRGKKIMAPQFRALSRGTPMLSCALCQLYKWGFLNARVCHWHGGGDMRVVITSLVSTHLRICVKSVRKRL